jgi:Ankyrin repeats (3 copies)/Ankyrin repeat
MKKILLLGVFLATGGCQGMHQRLGMMREEGDTASDTHRTWFKSFVDAVNNDNEEEEWDAVEKVLDEGQSNQQLGVTVTWSGEGQETGCKYTPLHYAAAKGNLQIVRELVEQRSIAVDIRTQGDKSTPLHLSASRGHLDIVKFLVEKGAKVEDTDAEGSSALHYAAAGGQGENNRDVIEYLVANGADLKKLTNTGTSLLGLAVFTGNMPVIEYWIDTCSNNSDPEIILFTTNALKMAKYRREKGDRGQAYIIRMLEEFLGTNK